MKVLLTAMNARYIHTNLAVRCLAKNLSQAHEVIIREYTINQHPEDVLQQIYLAQADFVAFSCYIWNIREVLLMASSLKKVSPETMIVLGGPEVSYDAADLMKRYDCIDFVVSGEGESTFQQLVDLWHENLDYTGLPGLSYRVRGQVYNNPPPKDQGDYNLVASPYESGDIFDENRIYYYESTRGCPFSCQFCLSGNENVMQELPLVRVFRDIDLLVENKVKQVKFVDRTFNANPKRALAIWRYLAESDQGLTNFHFEISASLLSEEMISFLKTVPEGLFQFEIGIQSTNQAALEAIMRPRRQERDFSIIRQLKASNNIHLHVDLIAGLPFEDYYSFRQSFDQVFSLKAHVTQLGFLKLLKGSGIRKNHLQYGCVFQDEAPYEILENTWISYPELVKLKGVEKVLEQFWNSGKYRNTIEASLTLTNLDPFSFFEQLDAFMELHIPPLQSVGHREQLTLFQSFLHQLLPEHAWLVDAALRYDYYLTAQHKQLPDSLTLAENPALKKRVHELLHSEEFLNRYFPGTAHVAAKHRLPLVKALEIPALFQVSPGGEIALAHELLHDSKMKSVVFITNTQHPRSIGNTIVVDLDKWEKKNTSSI